MWFENSKMTEAKIIFSVQESPDGGYEAQALGDPIFTQADSIAELIDTLRDAVACHFAEDARPFAIKIKNLSGI